MLCYGMQIACRWPPHIVAAREEAAEEEEEPQGLVYAINACDSIHIMNRMLHHIVNIVSIILYYIML